MKFARHLAAVVLSVAVVVGLGLLWAHASGGSTAAAGALRIKAGAIRVRPDDGFHLSDTGDLIRTCEIQAALAAVVITVSALWRRHRRMRRTRGSGPGGLLASPAPPRRAGP